MMQDNETFQDFKRRWDIAMINYIMVDCRTPKAGQPGHHDYPDILEVKANLLGEVEFARQYPGRVVYKTNAWLYERIIRSFANVSEKFRQRYPTINMYASNAMADADRNYLSYCQKMMDKDRSNGVISSSNLTIEVPEGRIKKKQTQLEGLMTTLSSYVNYDFISNYDAIVAKAIDKMNKLRIPCYLHNSAARDPISSSYHLMTQCNKPKPADLKFTASFTR
jgi:hypothetical protein